jgi:hypothetical protein
VTAVSDGQGPGGVTAAREGPPSPDVRAPSKHSEQEQSQTVAHQHAALTALGRRFGRRSAGGRPWRSRRDPLADIDHDPFDLAARGARDVTWGGYDAADLGLGCAHGEDCPGRRGNVA